MRAVGCQGAFGVRGVTTFSNKVSEPIISYAFQRTELVTRMPSYVVSLGESNCSGGHP
jgi:hypothetical protein